MHAYLNLAYAVLMLATLGFACYCLFFIGAAFKKKNDVASVVQIQCSSGDSEVMSFNVNFMDGEDEESKASKIKEAFDLIQERRDENHAKWLAVQAEAKKENEEKLANGHDLSLRSVAETRVN